MGTELSFAGHICKERETLGSATVYNKWCLGGVDRGGDATGGSDGKARMSHKEVGSQARTGKRVEAGVGSACSSTSPGMWKLEAEISLDKRLSFRFWNVLNDKLANPSRSFYLYLRTVSKEERDLGFLTGHCW